MPRARAHREPAACTSTARRCADLAFTDLPRLVAPGDLLVFNDTRVIKSRLIAAKPTGGRVELLLERLLGPHEALFQLRASHPPKTGSTLLLPGDARAEVVDATRAVLRAARSHGDVSFLDYLERHGEVPLPPYIDAPGRASDEARYQTVFARHAGRRRRADRGPALRRRRSWRRSRAPASQSRTSRCTSAPARSQPVRARTSPTHTMHAEWYAFRPRPPRPSTRRVRAAGRVVAVGTTSRARARIGGRGRRTVRAGDARDADLHHAGLPLPRRRPPAHQLPPAALDAADARVARSPGYGTIRAAYAHAIAQALPLLQLRRRDAARAPRLTRTARVDEVHAARDVRVAPAAAG